MILNNNLNKILIIDFGSQFTQLIARRIREIGIFSEIISHKKAKNLNIFNEKIKGIILYFLLFYDLLFQKKFQSL